MAALLLTGCTMFRFTCTWCGQVERPKAEPHRAHRDPADIEYVVDQARQLDWDGPPSAKRIPAPLHGMECIASGPFL